MKIGLSFADVTAAIFAEAVTDIRRRAIEQPWFGAPQDGPAGVAFTSERTAEPSQRELSNEDAFDPWLNGLSPEPETQGRSTDVCGPEQDPSRHDGIDL